MYMLIWVKSALSPQEIRERMLSDEVNFQKEMIAYLESCHVGEFLTGTMVEVKAKVPYQANARQNLHDVIQDEVRLPILYLFGTPILLRRCPFHRLLCAMIVKNPCAEIVRHSKNGGQSSKGQWTT